MYFNQTHEIEQTARQYQETWTKLRKVMKLNRQPDSARKLGQY